MSLAAACWWTLARTIVLCLLAWPLIVGIERWFRSLSDTRQPWAFALFLAPFLFPELLVGYTFREVALASPWRAEWLCASLLFVRIVPIGVVTLLNSPPALISAAALHCRWMLLRAHAGATRDQSQSLGRPAAGRQWYELSRCYWHGPIRRALPALGMMGLVSFQEFELAALLQTASWTDWFIAAQRVGLEQSEMLSHAYWPVLLQLPLLMGAFFWLSPRDRQSFEKNESNQVPLPRGIRNTVLVYLLAAVAYGCLIPLGLVAWYLPTGLKLFVRQSSQSLGLGREIFVAMMISLCAGITTWIAASFWSDARRQRRITFVVRQMLLLPGLIGSLLLSLAAVVLFQQPWFRPAYDTPLPWVLALIVWLFPRAVLLRLWVNASTRTESIHLAELLDVSRSVGHSKPTSIDSGGSPISERLARLSVRSSRLLFRLRDQPRFLAMGLLCYWAYLDLSTAYLLAPSGMPSGLVRLYNFMHFGRSAALWTESLFFFGMPFVAVFFVVQLIRMTRR